MKKRPEPRLLTVLGSTRITPNMHRVTLGGEGLEGFPECSEGAYIKLQIPNPGGEKPFVRTYTVRAQRENEIDVDFNIHGVSGPASNWAVSVAAGETIMVGGPGPAKLIHPSDNWHLLVGDMTALPAISVNLEQLRSDARGLVVISVMDKHDIQPLNQPENMELHWLVTPETSTETDLLDYVKSLDLPPGKPTIWSACEFASMRALRAHFKGNWDLSRDELYISSYWKRGSSEDRHKVEKRNDLDSINES